MLARNRIFLQTLFIFYYSFSSNIKTIKKNKNIKNTELNTLNFTTK